MPYICVILKFIKYKIYKNKYCLFFQKISQITKPAPTKRQSRFYRSEKIDGCSACDHDHNADKLFCAQRIALRTERFEIPVQLGFQFGVLRLFGGALFRVTESERSSVPQLLKVRFNNGDVGVMGGLGFNIRKFFIDFRISGYPRSRVWHDFTSEGIARRVKVPHDIVYGGSLGFFF